MSRKSWKYYIKDIVNYMLLSLLIGAIWMTYEAFLRGLFDEYVVFPILALIHRNAWTVLLLVGCLGWCIYDVVRHAKSRFIYHPNFIFGILWCVIICGFYRIQGIYNYETLAWKVTYVDVLLVIGIAYVIIAIINWASINFGNKKEKQEQNNAKGLKLLLDVPIDKLDEDEMDWSDEITKVKQLIQMPVDKHSLSIAINAPWGSGKTSFLNIIKNNVDKNRYDIIYFNPRDSKSVSEIQEDYFRQLISVLLEYDGRAKCLLRRYMAALQIIDDSSWLYRLLNVYNDWHKNRVKDELSEICKKLPKTILVIIDDFDRLRPNEIQEILKLLDSNASFANFVYLTAYDKSVVSKVLADYEHSEVANYTDKYFELEYDLPQRPYGYIRDYFVTQLSNVMQLDASDACVIKKVMTEKEDLFKTLLPTLRDVKRLINLMSVDYGNVRGEVYLYEYFYVHLIKYRYPDEFKALSLGKYTEDNVLRNFDGLFLRKEVNESADIKSLPLLRLLFACEGVYNEPLYRHIYQKQSFENYFINKLYNSLTIKEMRRIFDVEYAEMRTLIDTWLESEQQANDFSNYMQFLRMGNMESKEMFMKYATTAAYYVSKSQGNHGSTTLNRLIYRENLEIYLPKYGVDEALYKARMISILSDEAIDSNLSVLRQMHCLYKNKAKQEQLYIIKDADIWPYIKDWFIQIVDNNDLSEENIYAYLLQCIDHLDVDKKVILDKDCCEAYREHVTDKPEYYVEHFVRLGMESSDPEWNMIACEPFWNQIFGDIENLKAYAESCKNKGVNKIERMLNFIEIYVSNNCQSIELQHQGLVKEKIEADLVEEVKKLHALQDIEKKLNNSLKRMRKKENLHKRLQELKQKLDLTFLPVEYRVILSNKINDELRRTE